MSSLPIWFDIILALLPWIFAVVGGGWTLYRYLSEQEKQKRMQRAEQQAEHVRAMNETAAATWERANEQYKVLQARLDVIEMDFEKCKRELEKCMDKLEDMGA